MASAFHFRFVVLALTGSLAWCVACPAMAGGVAEPRAPKPPQEEVKAADLLAKPLPGQVDETSKLTAQEIFERQLKSDGPSSTGSRITDTALEKLDILANRGEYVPITDFIKKYPTDPRILGWLTTRANYGDVPLMWVLAERYGGTNSIELGVKWAYTALLGATQERALCLDNQVEFAPAQIAETHPHLLKLSRSNPFLIKESKVFAMTVLANATRYPDPTSWLCKPYASALRANSSTAVYAYDPIYYPFLRARARNKLRLAYDIAQPQEKLPALPAPVKSPPSAPK